MQSARHSEPGTEIGMFLQDLRSCLAYPRVSNRFGDIRLHEQGVIRHERKFDALSRKNQTKQDAKSYIETGFCSPN